VYEKAFQNADIIHPVDFGIWNRVNAQVKPGRKGSVDGAGDWRILGSKTAGHSADHDKIEVTGMHDYFRKLKFKVTNSILINISLPFLFY
jgi:hypothetical protein